MTRLLRVDASARREGSPSRALLAALEVRLAPAEVIRRDLAEGVPRIDERWIQARDTPADRRGPADHAALAWSDAAIAELRSADMVAIGLPVYNFGPPAALKAWIDKIARPRVTFRYATGGPVGLLTGKRAFVAFAAGGTRFGSGADFASGYIRHVLGFVGIHDVRFVLDETDLPGATAA